MSDPAQRAEVVAKLRAGEEQKKKAAHARADRENIPKRIQRADGTVMELMGFEGDRPIYAITHNSNAAISSGANLLLAQPYELDGSGFTIGVWDAGAARSTHRELSGRATVQDGGTPIDHATHVTGTIAAAGLQTAARGMSPAARIDSYEWNSDKSEMTARGASYPGEPGALYLSNHSYGYVAGWNLTGKASPKWDWWGSGTSATGVEDDFGRYNSHSRDSDALAASLPYFLMFRSAGNDRGDNPAADEPVSLSANGTTVVSYDSAVHPAGDASYKGGGYDTLGFDALAKNVVTVGAVSDAVAGGVRSFAVATMTSYSSWGPTDDGRIKPDLVANGESVHSSLAGGDSSYGSLSGTSMATPNATGSAQLLISHFAKLFPGHAMRGSTLKALLIHTCDDLGAPGPDYQNGWGLLNVQAAADLITLYRTSPAAPNMLEDRLTGEVRTRTYSLSAAPGLPVRATLCWADPAGATTNTGDSRTARLLNNLDLTIEAPDGTVHRPYIMPYVGNWSVSTLSAPAVPGKNNTDNVEQVHIAAPESGGTYKVTVGVDGTLANSLQNFSIVISGAAEPLTAPPPAIAAITPTAGAAGVTVLTLTGADFRLGANVTLTRSGQADVKAFGQEVAGDAIRCRVQLDGLAVGTWNVVVTNPDGQSAMLPNAFTTAGTLWQDSLESGAAEWTQGASSGASAWVLTTTESRSPAHSFFAPGGATRKIDELYSPPIPLPANGSNLRLSFWHRYNLQQNRDGGVIEFSLDGGAWFDVETDAGASFATGGYNSTLGGTGRPADRNPLVERRAWSGSATTFTQVAVDLNSAQYAGKVLRIRWQLATDSSIASEGWYIDDLSLSGAGGSANLPPSITSLATATPEVVTGSAAELNVLAVDDGGEENLTYTWSADGDFLAPVEFSDNGRDSSKTTTVTFSKAGTYRVTVTVRDAENLSVTSAVDVVVQQTLASLEISPAEATLANGESHQFSASGLDQFGEVMNALPPLLWSADGGGTIGSDGLFTATSVGGPFLIAVQAAELSAEAAVWVTGQPIEAWRTTHFSDAESDETLSTDLADADWDGLANLIEYALGTDPNTPTAGAAYNVEVENGFLSLTFQRPKGLPDVTYIVEATDDLEVKEWQELSLEVITSGDPETVRGLDTVPVADVPRRYIRLRVTRVESP